MTIKITIRKKERKKEDTDNNNDNYVIKIMNMIMIITVHCIFLLSDTFMKQFMVLNKIWVMEAFLSFGKYNNFQSDNLLYNSEYSNLS